ncbi:MAG TPA: hypothetical protein VGJ37_03195 [Pyrinomonadaceae bacterium]|jgi:hypothetical protein
MSETFRWWRPGGYSAEGAAHTTLSPVPGCFGSLVDLAAPSTRSAEGADIR